MNSLSKILKDIFHILFFIYKHSNFKISFAFSLNIFNYFSQQLINKFYFNISIVLALAAFLSGIKLEASPITIDIITANKPVNKFGVITNFKNTDIIFATIIPKIYPINPPTIVIKIPYIKNSLLISFFLAPSALFIPISFN